MARLNISNRDHVGLLRMIMFFVGYLENTDNMNTDNADTDT